MENNFGTRKHPSASKMARRMGFRDTRIKMAREAAEERQAKYDKLSLQQKLDALDMRLGKGLGAVKQRAKLQAMILEEKSKREAEIVSELNIEVTEKKKTKRKNKKEE